MYSTDACSVHPALGQQCCATLGFRSWSHWFLDAEHVRRFASAGRNLAHKMLSVSCCPQNLNVTSPVMFAYFCNIHWHQLDFFIVDPSHGATCPNVAYHDSNHDISRAVSQQSLRI